MIEVEKRAKALGRHSVDIRAFLDDVYQGGLHAKRIESLENTTLGVMAAGSLAVRVIGHALAHAKGKVPKHAVKQVDRLISNSGIDPWESFAKWVPKMVGARTSIVVAIDWTDFDADDQSTLALSLVTSHGRATPLLWLTMWKWEIKGTRNDIEDTCLARLAEVLPEGVEVTILADRGFGDHKLFGLLAELGFGYVIRFRDNISVTDEKGETRKAAAWVGKGGRARKIRNAKLTAKLASVPAVVCAQAKDMKDAWCLAVSDPEMPSSKAVAYYAKRWGIETSFRDTKDLRFGMGMDKCRIGEPARRDRLFLISAFAIVLLTLLGAAGEEAKLDRLLKVNTSPKRVYSLFRQGCMWFELIPTLSEERLSALMESYAQLIQKERALCGLFQVV